MDLLLQRYTTWASLPKRQNNIAHHFNKGIFFWTDGTNCYDRLVKDKEGKSKNDVVVGRREKHNGMSWVPEGSSCFAVMKAAIFNGEKNVWMNSKVFHFSLVDRKVA